MTQAFSNVFTAWIRICGARLHCVNLNLPPRKKPMIQCQLCWCRDDSDRPAVLKSLLSRWFLQSPEVALQLEIASAGSQRLALTCWHSHVVLLNCEGGSAVLRNSRDSSTMPTERRIHISLAVLKKTSLPGTRCFRTLCFSGRAYKKKIITQLFVSHVSAGGGSVESLVTSYSLWKHAQCGVIVTQKKHLLECGWNWEADMYSYSAQKCHNCLSHSEYLLCTAFPQNREHHAWNQFYIRGSFLLCPAYCTGRFLTSFTEAAERQDVKKKQNNISSEET